MIDLQEILQHLRAEYLEMPGLRLNTAQVQRLCGVDGTVCQTALDALVNEMFLRVTPDGYYARSTDGEIPRPRPAKARLGVDPRSVKAS
jgi:hypothetical protein